MKVCIVTLYKSINSGSYWQAKALEQAIVRLGHEVVFYDVKYPVSYYKEIYWNIIDTVIANGVSESIKYIRSIRDFSDLHKHMKLIGDNSVDSVDCIVLGSDTIWNLCSKKIVQNIDIFWGCRFTKKRVITYAGSAANTTVKMLKQYPEVHAAVGNWEAVSVRDRRTESILKTITDKEIKIVCDPTLLLTREDYKVFCTQPIRKKYIFLYLFKDLSDNQTKEITIFAKAHDLEVIQGINGKKQKAADFSIVNSPTNFLEYMIDASYIVTDTFHGTMFSLNLNKQFVSIDRKKQKVNDALAMFGFQDRLVSENQSLINVLKNQIDFNDRMGKIEALKSASWKFLKNELREYGYENK